MTLVAKVRLINNHISNGVNVMATVAFLILIGPVINNFADFLPCGINLDTIRIISKKAICQTFATGSICRIWYAIKEQ
jgi:hypothetical protein